MYQTLEDVVCHYGFYGLIHDNTVVSLGAVVGDDIEPNFEQRVPSKEGAGRVSGRVLHPRR